MRQAEVRMSIASSDGLSVTRPVAAEPPLLARFCKPCGRVFFAAVAMVTHHVDDSPEVFFHLIVKVDAKHPLRTLGHGGN